MSRSNIKLPAVTRDVIALNHLAEELKRARALHSPLNSSHEAYSVILEELDEFWVEVKKKRANRDKGLMFKELIQVAAMAVRATSDLELFVEESVSLATHGEGRRS